VRERVKRVGMEASVDSNGKPNQKKWCRQKKGRGSKSILRGKCWGRGQFALKNKDGGEGGGKTFL